MKTFSAAFNKLRLIHNAMLIGLFFFALTGLLLVISGGQTFLPPHTDRVLQLVAILFSVGLVFFGFRFFKKRILEIRHTNDKSFVKIEHYHKACIIWWALLEFPGLFAVICFIVTGNYAFFALAFFHVLILTVFMPRKENVRVLLDIREEDLVDNE